MPWERVTFTLTASQHAAGQEISDYYVSLSPRTTVKQEKARQVWLSKDMTISSKQALL